MAGLYLDDFHAGQVIRHPVTKTITESDNVFFCAITLNPQPLHIDFHYAAKMSPWGKPAVNSLYTLALMVGISVYDTTLGTVLANLGISDAEFAHPLFHGDTVRVETKILSVRPSSTKTDRGIVEFEHSAYNQHDMLVGKCVRKTMMQRVGCVLS